MTSKQKTKQKKARMDTSPRYNGKIVSSASHRRGMHHLYCSSDLHFINVQVYEAQLQMKIKLS